MTLTVWLSVNAQAMVRAIAAAVTAADLERAALYRPTRNGPSGLAALDEELDAALAPVRGKPFIVFHDAYQYLEAAYGLNAAGSITASPDRPRRENSSSWPRRSSGAARSSSGRCRRRPWSGR